MIMEGLRLMAVGMITVFAFLTLLVGMMKASAAFFEKFADRFPEEEHPEKSSRSSADRDGEIALVLAIAEAHRQGQRV
jgi:sodium pump decarboxylase gamma subunit